ncbi:MAG: hypothetical protein KBC41_01825 [Candidatus Pacebacteria bacterium]|nr:hypothetical protein [Candidatus Paceibacterota bacterium]MBP9866797.1 hypothetical protein [Candidatus Paceibacterota bacterium]
MNEAPLNLSSQENKNQTSSKEKLLGKYDKESVYKKIMEMSEADKDAFKLALNLNGFDPDQMEKEVEDMMFDDSDYTEERGAKISSLLGDFKYHTDTASKKLIARDLVYCLQGKVLH